MPKSPSTPQVALLCYRGKISDREYLLVTSRDTGRWVLPKGWVKSGKTPEVSALEEGWEEAGIVAAKETPKLVGHYSYNKRLEKGETLALDVAVYQVRFKKLERKFPESGERKRKWMTASKAAKQVDETSLTKLLKSLS
ncbi:NUDIX hydrolase [Donghicola sp. XS_ASV15]|uniref:NUDIX hydrolase n=1 Tax=Donghicola sp. XS_ASV15 TaxID=3241295 RepID=UPI0035156C5D